MIDPNNKTITSLNEFLLEDEDLKLYSDEGFISTLENSEYDEYDENDEDIQILKVFGYID